MNRTEFVVATTLFLFLAFLVGWFCSWVVHRLTRTSRADIGELERMAQALHEAEEARDRTVAQMQAHETGFATELHQTHAELDATMDDLRAARAEALELRDYIERARRVR